MEYLYVLASFIFVTAIALYLKSKRDKQVREMREQEKEFLMKEQIKASAEIEAKKKAQLAAKQKK